MQRACFRQPVLGTFDFQPDIDGVTSKSSQHELCGFSFLIELVILLYMTVNNSTQNCSR